MGEQQDGSRDLVRRFYRLQEERVQTYHLFDQGHAAYLKGAPNYNFPMYRQLVHEVTETFKHISEEVIRVEQSLREDHQSLAQAQLITKIQEAEQQKLEKTVKLQLVKQEDLDDTERDHQQEIDDLQQSLRECVNEINELLEELKYTTED